MAGKKEEVDSKEDLLLVPSVKGHKGYKGYKGYKRGLVSQQLTQMEESLLVCSICNGILYNACNYGNEQGMCCEPCLGVGEVAQGIGAIRTMVSNLRCLCPLSVKGCDWEGIMQGVWGHLDSCSYLVVSCPYGKYGCDVSLKRGQLDTHRRESREYHTELVMVHLDNRVVEQAGTIEQDHKTVERLDKLVSEMRRERKFYTKNEVIWRIGQIEVIGNVLQQQKQQPRIQQQQNVYGHAHTQPNIFAGPTFQLDAYYDLTLQLKVKQGGSLSFSLVNSTQTNSTGKSSQMIQYPRCQVIFRLTFYNKISTTHNLIREIGPLELKSTTQSLHLADVTSVFLLNGEFSHDDTILLQLLYSVTYA